MRQRGSKAAGRKITNNTGDCFFPSVPCQGPRRTWDSPRPLSDVPCKHRTGKTEAWGGPGAVGAPRRASHPTWARARIPRRREAFRTAHRDTSHKHW